MPLSIYRRKGGKVWHYRGTVDGRRLRGSTRTTDKARAQRIANEKENRQWKRHLDGPASVLTFAMAVDLYLDAGKPRRHLTKLLDHWKETPVKELTKGAIRQAAIDLFPNASGATRNRQVLVPAQSVINHAAEAELCPPIVKMKRFAVEKKVKSPASWEWVETFMSAASQRMAALACFMFLTGARISEALSLTWAELDLGSGTALIRQTKIGAERQAHLPPRLVVALANITGSRTGRVFRLKAEPLGAWNNAIKRAGIKPLSFHACRHGFATGLLDAGVNPKTVAERGGWRDTRHVFETYAHDVAAKDVTNLLVGTKLTRSSISVAPEAKDTVGVKRKG